MANEEQGDRGQILAQWSFPEYLKPVRSKWWYFWFMTIIVLLLVYSLITINFLFAVIVIISAIVIIMRAKYEPGKVNFTIYEDGLGVDGRFYDYDLIDSFYILYKPPEIKNLYFEFKSLVRPRLNIPLENQNPLKIREALIKYLAEDLEKEEEPTSEVFRKVFKL